MMEQPAAIQQVLQIEREKAHNAAKLLQNAKVQNIHIVGIGTSWHAALVGELMLKTVAGVECRAWHSFDFAQFPPPLSPSSCVLVLSHRGTKKYSAKSIALGKQNKAIVGLVTSRETKASDELIASLDFVLRTSTGEKASAFTISHTTAMTAILLLAIELGLLKDSPRAKEVDSSVKDLPKLVQKALDMESSVQDWAKAVFQQKIAMQYFVGFGFHTSTAYEVALKLKEACYVNTEGFQLEQFLHGPFCAIHGNTMVTFVIPPGNLDCVERSAEVIKATKSVGSGHTAAIIFTAADPNSAEGKLRQQILDAKNLDTVITLPVMDEVLSPIVYLVILQLFTYWLSMEHKTNPDVFRRDNPQFKAAIGSIHL